jgi:Peroxidase, family 2
MLRKFRRITLHEIGKHNAVEHNGSLVHHDIPEGQIYAPIEIDHSLVDVLVSDVKPSAVEVEESSDPTAKFLMNYEDVARARVRREAECKPIDGLHAEIARGEMAIILGVWEVKTKDKVGIPVDYFKRWIGEERLPDGWKPDHTQGLLDVISRSSRIRGAMKQMRKEQ